MVDGAARDGTLFTLSHWPRTPTPPTLRGDLSAQLVRDALRHPDALPADVEVASLDHYDVDGVVSLALAVVEGLDAANGELLVEAARVGDFDVVTDERAAWIAFALNAFEGRPDAASDAVAILGDLASEPERFESMWQEEWSTYQASVGALAGGGASIEERPELDLAVVRVDPGFVAQLQTGWKGGPLHPAAVHSATSCLRVATIVGTRMELRYRYESWVRTRAAVPDPGSTWDGWRSDSRARRRAPSSGCSTAPAP